jgi:hypothetical protein
VGVAEVEVRAEQRVVERVEEREQRTGGADEEAGFILDADADLRLAVGVVEDLFEGVEQQRLRGARAERLRLAAARGADGVAAELAGEVDDAADVVDPFRAGVVVRVDEARPEAVGVAAAGIEAERRVAVEIGEAEPQFAEMGAERGAVDGAGEGVGGVGEDFDAVEAAGADVVEGAFERPPGVGVRGVRDAQISLPRSRGSTSRRGRG